MRRTRSEYDRLRMSELTEVKLLPMHAATGVRMRRRA